MCKPTTEENGRVKTRQWQWEIIGKFKRWTYVSQRRLRGRVVGRSGRDGGAVVGLEIFWQAPQISAPSLRDRRESARPRLAFTPTRQTQHHGSLWDTDAISATLAQAPQANAMHVHPSPACTGMDAL